MAFTDIDLINLYREWSERTWAAGFVEPTQINVESFRQYLTQRKPEFFRYDILEYEQRFIDEFNKQEKTAPLPQPSEETP